MKRNEEEKHRGKHLRTLKSLLLITEIQARKEGNTGNFLKWLKISGYIFMKLTNLENYLQTHHNQTSETQK